MDQVNLGIFIILIYSAVISLIEILSIAVTLPIPKDYDST